MIQQKEINLFDERIQTEKEIQNSNLDILKIEYRTIDQDKYDNLFKIINELKTFDTNDTANKKCVFSEFNKSEFLEFYYQFFKNISTNKELIRFFDYSFKECKHLIQYIYLIENHTNKINQLEEFIKNAENLESNELIIKDKSRKNKDINDFFANSEIPWFLFFEGGKDNYQIIRSWGLKKINPENIPVYNLYMMIRSHILQDERFSFLKRAYDYEFFQDVKSLDNSRLNYLREIIVGPESLTVNLNDIIQDKIRNMLTEGQIEELKMKVTKWRDFLFQDKKIKFSANFRSLI